MYQYEHPHPAVTVDIVLFAVRDETLKVLLIERGREPYRGRWALPGGFVEIDEGLEEAAVRELREETGIGDIWLTQLHAFGRPDRDPRERVISVAYYGMIPFERSHARAATDARAVRWLGLHELPALAFDHTEILRTAHRRLTGELDEPEIALRFMPREFTLSELRRLHEAILETKLDARAFADKMLGSGLIEKTGHTRTQARDQPQPLYRATSRP
jgi:8-oxo-dGTP diphosphatase